MQQDVVKRDGGHARGGTSAIVSVGHVISRCKVRRIIVVVRGRRLPLDKGQGSYSTLSLDKPDLRAVVRKGCRSDRRAARIVGPIDRGRRERRRDAPGIKIVKGHDACLSVRTSRERDVGRRETACRRSTICDRNIVPRESGGRRRKIHSAAYGTRRRYAYMAAVADKIDRDAQVRGFGVNGATGTNHKGSWNYISTRVGAGIGVGRARRHR